ncbi:MAG: GGDEF domain-containing protein [Legionellaceae bacterium]|nr:GGDEF domain-containing protein [Legionellaceae bacterium]
MLHRIVLLKLWYSVNRLSSQIYIFLCLFILGVIGYLDYSLGHEMGFSFFYLLPITLMALKFEFLFAIIFAVLSAFLWGGLDVLSGHIYSQKYMIFWNIGIRALIFIVVIYLVFLLKEILLDEKQKASTDFLTGAKNLRSMAQLITFELERMKRGGPQFSIIYLDVDKFKQVNDLYGHKKGDELLKEMVQIFQQNIRSIDEVSRIGGDEFILFFPNTGENVKTLFERIQAEIFTRTFFHATMSAGILTCRSSDMELDRLIEMADKLMYKAKKRGGNQFFVFTA